MARHSKGCLGEKFSGKKRAHEAGVSPQPSSAQASEVQMNGQVTFLQRPACLFDKVPSLRSTTSFTSGTLDSFLERFANLLEEVKDKVEGGSLSTADRNLAFAVAGAIQDIRSGLDRIQLDGEKSQLELKESVAAELCRHWALLHPYHEFVPSLRLIPLSCRLILILAIVFFISTKISSGGPGPETVLVRKSGTAA